MKANKVLRKREKGFTFIELILVVSMMAMIGMAVYGSFSLGLDVFRATSREKPFNDLAVFQERFAMDIRSMLYIPEMDFAGDPNKVLFYVNNPENIIFPENSETEEKLKTIKKIEYEISENGKITRKIYEYGSSEPYLISTALEDSRGVKFEYLEEGEKEFIDSIEVVPEAIRLSGDGDLSNGEFTGRIFEVPISG